MCSPAKAGLFYCGKIDYAPRTILMDLRPLEEIFKVERMKRSLPDLTKEELIEVSEQMLDLISKLTHYSRHMFQTKESLPKIEMPDIPDGPDVGKN